MRNAVDMFATEHGGTWPGVDEFVAQMTTYSDETGATNATKTTKFIYGPYLRKVPPAPLGSKKGSTGVAAADGIGVGWLYNEDTGAVTPNTGTLTDVTGKLYTEY